MAQSPSTHVPPQNIDAEESVLGAMLVFEPAITKVIDEVKLKASDFYLDRHRVIFTEVYDLYEASKPVDELTVTEALTQHNKLTEAGGKEYVSELAAKVPAAGNAKHYAEIVQENALLRRLLEAGQSIQGWVNERKGEPRELSDDAERLLFEVAHSEQSSDFREIGEILSDEVDRLEKLSTGENDLTGTPSGFRDLDNITGGFQPGNLIIIAARPAMGKCLAGSTLIYDPESGARRRLDEVVASVQRGEDAWVASMGPDLKLRTSRVSAAESNGVKPTFRLRTKLGREIEATSNHRICTLGGWKMVGEMRAGDRVGIPTTLPGPPSSGQMEALREPDQSRRGFTNVAVGLEDPAVREWVRSDIAWDEIVAIDSAGAQETYDLQVPGDECFVADDIVVHNSALVVNMAENMSMKHGRPVAFFSLEMSEVELAQRFIACRSRIPGDRLRKGKVSQRDWPKVVRACGELESAPLWIDDSSDLGLLDLRAKARRLHAQEQDKGGLGCVIVDYMQLMRADTSRNMNRVEQVGQMSRGLKIMARELDIPVIALSQLSRAPEQRPDKRPILSDLRESGSIEQDADVVAFLYRDEYYNHDSEDEGLAEVIISKHRNGPIGTTSLAFIAQYPKFMDRAQTDRPVEQASGEGPPMADVAEF